MGFGPRPTGVSILVVLSGLVALIYLLAMLGVVFILSLTNNSSFMQALRDSGAPQWLIDNFRSVFLAILLVSIIFMIVYGLLAYGFWTGQRWAWTLGFVFAAINIVWTVVQFVILPGTSGWLSTMVSITIPVIILSYLARSNVGVLLWRWTDISASTRKPTLNMIVHVNVIARRGRAADGKVFDLAEEGPPSIEKVDHASGWARTQARAQKRHSPDRG